MSRRAATLLLPLILLVVAAGIAGCGDRRAPAPNFGKVAGPAGARELSYPAAGLRLAVPKNWAVLKHAAPLLAVISSGPAVIALWRYPTTASPPAGAAELSLARRALLSAARRRDPGLSMIRSALTTIDGRGAVILDTLQRVGGAVRQDRSVHVYLPHSEIVLEEYAPPPVFHSVDHAVFSPARRSLHLDGNPSA